MKQFLSSALGAFVGTVIGFFAIGFTVFLFTIIALLGLGYQSEPPILENSILHLKLEGEISDKIVTDEDFGAFFGMEGGKMKLYDIVRSIDNASKDKRIVGIFLDCRGVEAGLASCDEIRNAIMRFKKSGKWVYAYGDSYSQADYYISSVADSIFINPEGMLDLHGLSAKIPYFKPLLDKVGVEVQVFKVGKFKSAVEPYILNEMSDENKEQTNLFLENMWKNISSNICVSRKVDKHIFNSLVDGIVATRPTSFLIDNKLVDSKCYAFDFIKNLKEKTHVVKGENLRLVTPKQYVNSFDKNENDDEILVLYAEGEINSQNLDGIIAKNMIEEILSAADNKNVKGLVMRVNSPGGSAFDSEQIWAALETFKKTGKPFAVSMGDYAASGGYYISCGADRIFAEKNTLTGSIGIFGMVPNLGNVINTIGINVCEVSTNPNANFPSIDKPMNDIQLAQMQAMVERGYDLFTRRCADGRNMKIDKLKSIAEGRVWDGLSAKEIGLVDEIGDIDNAIKWVAKKANIVNYDIKEMPESTNPLDYYLSKYFTRMITKSFFNVNSDRLLDGKRELENIVNIYPVQAKMNMAVEL